MRHAASMTDGHNNERIDTTLPAQNTQHVQSSQHNTKTHANPNVNFTVYHAA